MLLPRYGTTFTLRALTAQDFNMKVTVMFAILAVVGCAMVQESEQKAWSPFDVRKNVQDKLEEQLIEQLKNHIKDKIKETLKLPHIPSFPWPGHKSKPEQPPTPPTNNGDSSAEATTAANNDATTLAEPTNQDNGETASA